jgi:hypothetical protein
MSLDPYKILQVPSYADRESIDAAYRRLARLYHPDISILPDAEERTRELNQAYSLLKDPESRLMYDRARHAQDFPFASPVRSSRPGRRSSKRSRGKIDWWMFSGMLLLAMVMVAAFYLCRAAFGLKSAGEFPSVPVTGGTRAGARQTDGAQASGFPDCVFWETLRQGEVGERLCVYGQVDQVEEIAGAGQVIRFGERRVSFTIRGSSFNYRDVVQGMCIAAVGELRSDAGSFFMDTATASLYLYLDCQ